MASLSRVHQTRNMALQSKAMELEEQLWHGTTAQMYRTLFNVCKELTFIRNESIRQATASGNLMDSLFLQLRITKVSKLVARQVASLYRWTGPETYSIVCPTVELTIIVHSSNFQVAAISSRKGSNEAAPQREYFRNSESKHILGCLFRLRPFKPSGRASNQLSAQLPISRVTGQVVLSLAVRLLGAPLPDPHCLWSNAS